MKIKKIVNIILFFCFSMVYCQAPAQKLIHGQIVVESGQVSGVTIVNLNNEKSTVSDNNGQFYILAQANDLLVFSSVNLEYHRRIIEDKDLKDVMITIKMTAKVVVLEEVVINANPEINALALGIISVPAKKYTVAERRLYTATSSPVESIINLISGRTAMLEKNLETEKKEKSLVILQSIFDNDYFTNNMKIPQEHINGFQYYCVENKEINEVIKTKNKIKIEFFMLPLAKEFNRLLLDKNETMNK